jgi:peptidoglycan-N-acetylglucosamine deacetylase
MTIHPDVSGRPQVILMLERIIEHINEHDGIRWSTMDQIADDFAQRFPRGSAQPDGAGGLRESSEKAAA